MEFVTTPGWDAALAWCEANMETVREGYSFSKENVIVWTQFTGAHLIKQGIRVNCIIPGWIMTERQKTLWLTNEARTRTLFSGDVIYDGPLLDDIPGANVADYLQSMRRLRALSHKAGEYDDVVRNVCR